MTEYEFELLLKNAIKNYGSDYAFCNETTVHEFSHDFEKRINKLIKQEKSFYYPFIKTPVRTVSTLAAALAIIFTATAAASWIKAMPSGHTELSDVVYHSDLNAPDIFGNMPNPTGGDGWDFYFYPITCHLVNNIGSDFINLAGVGEFDKWIWRSTGEPIESVSDYVNMYTFLRDFPDIDRKAVKEMLTKQYLDVKKPDYGYYTEEDIDILMSGNPDAIEEHFISDTSLFVDGFCYTPQWFYVVDISEYYKINFDKQELNRKMEIAVQKIHQCFGKEQADYLQQKIESYTGIKMDESKITTVTFKITEPEIVEDIGIEDNNEYIEIEEK